MIVNWSSYQMREALLERGSCWSQWTPDNHRVMSLEKLMAPRSNLRRSAALILENGSVSVLRRPDKPINPVTYCSKKAFCRERCLDLSFLTCSLCGIIGTKYSWVALPYSRQSSLLVSRELSMNGLSNASILPMLHGIRGN